MRLTLRTLLAFLDKTLAPGEVSVLGDKIKQSKFATSLVDRIATVVDDKKLPAMRIDAQGTAGDANTVAEYLDNSLDPNVVVDFEQACLSEDARLAEVAACHQILSSVLTENESVTVETKEAIKRSVQERVEAKAIRSKSVKQSRHRVDAVQDSVPALENDSLVSGDIAHSDSDGSIKSLGFEPKSFQEKPVRGIDLSDASHGHVPDYLRAGGNSHWGNWLTTGALVAALVVLGWISLGSLESVRELFGQPDPVAQMDKDPTAKPKVLDVKVPKVKVADPKNTNGAVSAVVPPTAIPTVSETPSPDNGSMSPDEADKMSTEGASDVASPDVAVPVEVDPEAPVVDSELGIATSINPGMGLIAPFNDLQAANEVPLGSGKSTYSSSIVWRPEVKAAAQAIVLATNASAPTRPSYGLVSAGEGMQPGEHWLVPTACRTDCWIEPGIRWKVADYSDLSIGETISTDKAVVRLRVGRALVSATPNCQDLIIESGDGRSYTVHFNDPNGVVAVEVRYEVARGAKLARTIDTDGSLRGMMVRVTTFTGVVGESTITLNGTPIETLAIGGAISWYDQDAPVRMSLETMPWWFKSASARPVDLEASQSLYDLLVDWKKNNMTAIVPDVALAVEPESSTADSKSLPSIYEFLKSQTAKRSTVTSMITLQLLLLNGDYSQMAGTNGVLAESMPKAQRAMLLETLEQSLGADPSRELYLKDHIEDADPARANRIIELLTSPSNEELDQGHDRVLVDAISSPFLDERVLAIHQLSRVTGRDLGYQADRPSPESTQAWKKLLIAKKIRWSKIKN